MDWNMILWRSLWSGVSAAGLGIVFTTPLRFVFPAFLCGAAGRFVRDCLMGWGVTQNWSTVVAAGVVVFVATAFTRKKVVPPVVLVSGVLPLGATVAMFNALLGLMKVSSSEGLELEQEVIKLSANAGKVFTTSLAIAVGLVTGVTIVRLLTREAVWEEA